MTPPTLLLIPASSMLAQESENEVKTGQLKRIGELFLGPLVKIEHFPGARIRLSARSTDVGSTPFDAVLWFTSPALAGIPVPK
jgi:hypothetical protein